MQVGDTVSYLTQPLREEYATIVRIREDGVSIDVETEDGVIKQILIKSLLEQSAPAAAETTELDSVVDVEETTEPRDATDEDY